jgi:site-specific DNA-methyltransferase (adenine-specific)
MQTLISGDLIKVIPTLNENSIDIVVTSPPYNRKMAYSAYKDNKKRATYLLWTREWIRILKPVLKEQGSFFLNVGDCPSDPWLTDDIAAIARQELFHLQNKIHWVKAISIKNESHGHYKPINSNRYLNNLVEMVYHFTLSGNVPIQRLSIGVPYMDKSNIHRWNNQDKDVRCRGNVWFIPYDTRQQKYHHPAIFPDTLPEFCIKLHGYDENTIVLDPFVGSGTTIFTCNKLGIKSIGIDIDESYINSIKEKLKEKAGL